MDWKFIGMKYTEEAGRMVHLEGIEIPGLGVLLKTTQTFYNKDRVIDRSSFVTNFIPGAMLEELGSGKQKYWKVVRNG